MMEQTKRNDIILAVLLSVVMAYRIGCMIYTTVINQYAQNIVKIGVVSVCAIMLVLVFRIIIIGTIQESTGCQTCSRGDYLYVMSWVTGNVAVLTGCMSAIYFFNMQIFAILGYTSIPCFIAFVTFYVIYKIEYSNYLEGGND